MANLTLIDWAKKLDPDGSVANVANILSQTNEILTDAVYIEGNLPTGHRVTIQTGLPTIYYRSYNDGVIPSKGTTAQVDESCSMMEAYSEVDIDLAKLNGNEMAFRKSQSEPFIEGMNQKQASTMFYGNPGTDPQEYMGLAGRYSDLSAGNAQNILAAGGASANAQTSVWLVCWGDHTIHCIFPKGSKAGLLQEDLGQSTSYDAGGSGKRMQVYTERFQWMSGLVVKDWRFAVRICNVGTTDGDANSISDLGGTMAVTSTENVLHQMVMAIARIPNFGRCKSAFYMNRTVHAGLQRTALEKSNAALSISAAVSQFGTGQSMLSFQGIPIRQCDSLVNTEAVIS